MSSNLRSITIEDLYKYKPVSHPRISPDGKRIAFVVTATDERTHKYRSSIWIVPVEGGEARQFTAGPANAHSPAWSLDGNWLAFVSCPPVAVEIVSQNGAPTATETAHTKPVQLSDAHDDPI